MTTTEHRPATNPASSPGRRRSLPLVAAAVVAAAAVSFAAFAVVNRSPGNSLSSIRASGLPANVPTSTANLMGLDPVHGVAAPNFRLTDQHGRTLSLSSFRGHPVVLEFMDPHCIDICPIVSHEFVDAYRDLGREGRGIDFVAVNVNQYHLTVAAMAAFSRAHQLDSIPTWHFFTGPVATLRSLWSKYGITVIARGPNADIVHSSIIFFIGPNGQERFVAAPTDDHTKSGRAYLPTGQLTSWGRGIGLVAQDLAR